MGKKAGKKQPHHVREKSKSSSASSSSSSLPTNRTGDRRNGRGRKNRDFAGGDDDDSRFRTKLINDGYGYIIREQNR